MQERRNPSALAMELRLSCTNPSIFYINYLVVTGCIHLLIWLIFSWTVITFIMRFGMNLLIHSQTSKLHEIWVWISNFIPHITGHELWEWISNSTPHITGNGDFLSILGFKLVHVIKRGSWYFFSKILTIIVLYVSCGGEVCSALCTNYCCTRIILQH